MVRLFSFLFFFFGMGLEHVGLMGVGARLLDGGLGSNMGLDCEEFWVRRMSGR